MLLPVSSPQFSGCLSHVPVLQLLPFGVVLLKVVRSKPDFQYFCQQAHIVRSLRQASGFQPVQSHVFSNYQSCSDQAQQIMELSTERH